MDAFPEPPLLFIAGQSEGTILWPVVFSMNAFIFFSTFLLIFYLHSYLFPELNSRDALFFWNSRQVTAMEALSTENIIVVLEVWP